MARLAGLAAGLQGGAWSARRALRLADRRVGAPGLAAAGLTAVALVAWAAGVPMARQAADLQRELDQPVVPARHPVALPGNNSTRLREFQALLAPHEDIPAVVQDLLARGDKLGLRMPKGEYRLDTDLQGGFARYRMVMPISGEPESVQRFLGAALAGHKSLALESLQFKRESVSARSVEARVQWTLLVRLPSASGASPTGERP